MHTSFSRQDIEFQNEVREWLASAWPKALRDKSGKSAMSRLSKDDLVRWQKELAKKGWAATNWPSQYGGAGFSPSQNYIFDLERAKVGAPGVVPFGITMVAPVIMKYGSEAQKKFFLPKILNSDIWFCQGYSEPGSGSDLASLATKGVIEGDQLVINGTKTWTTMAQYADWMFCLVRTATEEIPQKGISFVLIDMKTPGISIKPIVTLDKPADGEQEINMVYFEDVCVPLENVVGEMGKGWTYAKYLLEFERGNAYSPALHEVLRKLRSFWREDDSNAEGYSSRSLRRDIDRFEIDILALEYTELRILGALSAGQNVGPESSMLKTRGTELQQRGTELFLELSGMKALPFDELTAEDGDNTPSIFGESHNGIAQNYFNTRKVSIYAGSNEIQRNIMSKLVLGL